MNIETLFHPLTQYSQWIYSLMIVIGAMGLRSVWLKLHWYNHPELELEQKRHFLVTTRNMMLVGILLMLLGIWSVQLKAFALSMVAVAAATVVALKELLMCFSGSILRVVTKQYSVGDYIEINHIRGRVVDINLLNTLVMQLSPNPLIGRLSGKTVSFPNSLLLNTPLYRDNILHHYVVHMFEIPVPIHLDSDEIVPRLQAVLYSKTSKYVIEISEYFEKVQLQKLFITPATEPSISRVPFDDKVYKLVIRFASPVTLRVVIQQEMIDKFMQIQYRLLNDLPLDCETEIPPTTQPQRHPLAQGFTLNRHV